VHLMWHVQIDRVNFILKLSIIIILIWIMRMEVVDSNYSLIIQSIFLKGLRRIVFP